MTAKDREIKGESLEDDLKLTQFYERLTAILNNPEEKKQLFEILFSTKNSSEKSEKLIKLINIPNSQLTQIDHIGSYSYTKIKTINELITDLLDGANDILHAFIWGSEKLINRDSREGSQNI